MIYGVTFFLIGVCSHVILDIIIPKIITTKIKPIKYPPINDTILCLVNMGMLSTSVHYTLDRLSTVSSDINIFSLLPKIFVGIFLSNAIFYYSHRLLHSKQLWNYHRIHHKYKTPNSLLSFYAHPIEICMSNISTLCLPLLIIRLPNIITIPLVYVGLFQTMLSHATHLTDMNAFHIIHHQKIQINFGWENGILDRFHNTDRLNT